MKCYAYDNEIEGTTELYWCETAGEAKQYFANDHVVPFTWIRVYREPWADKYGSVESIPAKEFWKHGWWLPCTDCGKQVLEGEGKETEHGVLCFDCIRERESEEL